MKVLVENSSVVRALRRGRSQLSHALVEIYIAQTRSSPAVETRWVPGHTGITDNEETDKFAKAALSKFSPDTITESSEILVCDSQSFR